jgi:hypothetical protein
MRVLYGVLDSLEEQNQMQKSLVRNTIIHGWWERIMK